MLPLLAIGGVIGAVMSIAKGASWVSDQFSSANSSASVGGKASGTSQAGATASSFESTLAAQTAGQPVPASASTAPATSPVPSPVTVPQPQSPASVSLPHGTDYTALARMRAGLFAYSHVGEHQGNQGQTAKPPNGVDSPVTASLLAGT